MGRHSTCHEHRPGREETADLTPVRRQQHPADSTARERLRELMLAGPGLTSHAEVCTIAHSLPRCGLAGAWGRADCESQTEGSRVGGLSDAAMVVPMRQEPLRVAIVGGGIGGAAAAHALLRRGIAVGLYQEAPGLSEVGAGVALQPNGIRMLRQLGLGSELLRWGARWSDPQFRRPDGSYIASMWPPGWAMPLRSMACIAPTCWPCSWIGCPADIIATDHRCVAFAQDEQEASLTFANGRRVVADVVVTADGVHSKLQAYVAAPSPPLPRGGRGVARPPRGLYQPRRQAR
jgi:FAD binding domain